MSAGNHAQAVARHARLSNVGATIVMPKFTPATKVTRTASWGANVVLHGETLAEAAAHAQALAAERGLVFVHPYDDVGVMAGQGTLAMELLQDVPDLDVLVIPVGGGGTARRLRDRGEGDEAGHHGYRRRGRGLFRHGAAARRRNGVGGWPDHRRRHRRARRRREAARHHPRTGRRSPGRAGAHDRGGGRPAGGRRQGGGGRRRRRRRRRAARLFRALSRPSASAWRSPAATSTRASCPTCCCATCCATAGCCGCICKFPIAPACWPTSPARSATPAATSSRSRTSACSPHRRSRRRNWR